MERYSSLRLIVAAIFTLAIGFHMECTEAASSLQSSPFTRTIYLVRHGAYVQDDKADPSTGPGLTALGIAQARLVAARLRGMPVHFYSMTSSTMTRARETAAVMHETLSDVPMAQSASLSECGPPTWKAKVEAPSEESLQCQSRIEDAFKTYFIPAEKAHENNIIVAHGNVIRYFVAKALGVDTRAWLGMSVAHVSLTLVRVKADGSMSVLSVGDVGHLPPNMQSWGTDADLQLSVPAAPKAGS